MACPAVSGIHVRDVAERRRQASVAGGGPGEGGSRVAQAGGVERARLADADRDHDRPVAAREGQRLAERAGEAALEEERAIDADRRTGRRRRSRRGCRAPRRQSAADGATSIVSAADRARDGSGSNPAMARVTRLPDRSMRGPRVGKSRLPRRYRDSSAVDDPPRVESGPYGRAVNFVKGTGADPEARPRVAARRRAGGGGRRGRLPRLGHRSRDAADDRDDRRDRALGDRYGRPRRGRDRAHHRRHAARPVLRPGLRPRQRADVADGGLAAHLGRPAGRGVRGEPARHGQVHPDARLARRGPARPRRRRARAPGPSSTRTRRASTPGWTRIAGRSGWRSSSPASRRSRGRTSTRSRGARSRPGTWAATSTRRCSATWPTRSSAIRRGRMSCSRPTARAPRSSPRPACPGRAAPATRARSRRRARAGGRARPRRRRPSHRQRRPSLAPDEAAAWHAVAGLGQGLLQTAGLDAADGLASDHGIGSNDWVVGPAMSATGGALLANDPHLGISMPSIWYINGLHCRTVVDAPARTTSPASRSRACPGVVLGHNARIAWGATNIDPDVQDLVIETVDPADPDAYLHDGTSRAVRRSATSRSRSAARHPVDLEIRSTVHGPILNGVDDRLDGRAADGHPLDGEPRGRTGRSRRSSAWTRRRASRTSARRWRCTARPPRTSSTPTSTATSATSSRATSRSAPNPADRGDRPVRGDDGSGEWTGRIPFDDLPWQFDPGGRLDRHRQQRRGRRRATRTSSPRNGTRAIAPSASST